jgi:hypothetical protein
MKLLSILLLSSILTSQLNSQIITGKVFDSSNGEPLEYVSIGVINTSIGTITDAKGNFKIDVRGQSQKDIVRISMISYKPQTFTIEELSQKENTINLIAAPTQLAEIIIKPSGKSRQVGTTGYDRIGNWCGWGGSDFGKGNEIGMKLELGTSPVQLKSLHIHVHRQSFDSSLYRLHIRTIADKSPFDELLNNNIILTITKESGWVDFDLIKYNIVLEGDVALTLEWVKVVGINKNRAMKIRNKMTSEYVLFNQKRKQGCIYTRWGTEAKWNINEDGSPSIYVTIQE